jgi:hypothetical protein
MSEQTNTFLSSKFWISDKYFSQPKLLLCNETLEKSDNQEWTSETLTTLVTKDTGRGQTKQHTQHNTTDTTQYSIPVSSLPISMPD